MPGYERGDHPVLIECNSSVAESPLVAMGTRSNVFCARLNPLDRASTRFFRSQRTYRHLWIARNLDAKATTDIGCLHANAVDVDAKVGREKLDSERRERVVALVINAVVFRITLRYDHIVLQRRAGETVEMHPDDVDDIGGLAK